MILMWSCPGPHYYININGWVYGVYNVTFNNISVISWWPVYLLVETGVLGENYRPAARHWQTLSHNVVSSTPRREWNSNSQLL
jgi:hypothetical protein